MGRPTRCVPQYNPFIGYDSLTTSTSTSTTIVPENLNPYIILPISGFPCPEGAYAVTTTTLTSTTLSPLVVDNDKDNCSLYNVSIIFETQEMEFNCSSINNLPASGSAVVRYQPCGSGLLVNQIIYEDKDFCVVKDNIRLLSGNAELEKLIPCQRPFPCDIIITELLCDIQIKNITCDIHIELLSL